MEFLENKSFHVKYICLVILITELLSGCMFHPIYANKENLESSLIQKELVKIGIVNKKGTLEQIFRADLEDLLIPSKNINADKIYTLEFSIKSRDTPLSILKNNTVTHYNANVRINYKFSEGSKVIKKGTLSSSHEYKNTESHFATYVAKKSITKQLLEEASNKLRYIIISSLINYKKNGNKSISGK